MYIKFVITHLKEEREKEKRNELKVFSLDQLDNNTALVDKVADDNNCIIDTLNINEEVENVMNIINHFQKKIGSYYKSSH